MSRLQVKAARLPADGEQEGVWRALVANYCCDEMEEAWEDRVVAFGDHEGGAQEPAVNVFSCNVWPEGPIWTEYSIRFCPFCGEEIDLQTVES